MIYNNSKVFFDDVSSINIQHTDAYFPENKTIQRFIEEQSLWYPNRVAVCFHGQRYTYSDINRKANLLAKFLRDTKGVKTGEIVGIVADRSLEMIVGVYAIIKAGGVYMPISTDLPSKRIEYLIYDSGINYVLVKKNDAIKTDSVELINIDVVIENETTVENLVNVCEARDPIYVIYTSGTTGKPKGVVVEHRSVVNRLNWMQKMYPLSKDDVILQKTPIVFDVSVWELFWWSIAGAQLCLLDPGMERFPQAIIDSIEKNHVTVVHFVPSMLFQFLKYIEDTDEVNRLSSLRYVFTSGEVLSPICVELFNKILYTKTGARIINLYGPTEATVDVTCYNCPTEGKLERVPIGKPIDNTKIYILSNGEIQPIGKVGEICISGVGVARGYLNNQELTMERFIENPLIPNERMYKTGDLGAFMKDGNIEYHGRKDCQVKIRGLRIELEEIESSIMELENIKQCAVVNIEKNSDVLLIAFIVPSGEIDIKLIKDHLRGSLPQYMVPNRITLLEELPVLPTGKIDRNMLKNI
ncbi:amino acid adenylation domain-containing protein [Clostridium cavendishii DSM 21758]|uniref:Amino acid adenylation domain-containing protein n=1 Tax=Clostridium cavendishii DSM 21758 TaxID=1121302 RepID=A0A1M6MTK2_9CLOT|nr:amino acid adenylation domain-containing protein [Clostridium cavendishii]SHJ86736.1 amino acid adenylation domain-containing protein [Clostridium cavendishii DSM 21758]